MSTTATQPRSGKWEQFSDMLRSYGSSFGLTCLGHSGSSFGHAEVHKKWWRRSALPRSPPVANPRSWCNGLSRLGVSPGPQGSNLVRPHNEKEHVRQVSGCGSSGFRWIHTLRACLSYLSHMLPLYTSIGGVNPRT